MQMEGEGETAVYGARRSKGGRRSVVVGRPQIAQQLWHSFIETSPD